MATIVFKRAGYGVNGPIGRRMTLADAQLAKVLAPYKISYGQVPSGPADPVTGVVPMRDMTDDEVTIKIFDGLLQGLLDQGNAHARSIAGQPARDAVVNMVAASMSDNV